MKSVLISIRPKWCELIASGKKTIEVRKTHPKLPTPFKCYIYCTKERGCANSGKVIGEFVCLDFIPFYGGKKVQGLFESDEQAEAATPIVLKKACITEKDLWAYEPKGNPIGWCISDVVIYDAPHELSEFRVEDKEAIKACKHRFRFGQPRTEAERRLMKGGYGCAKTGVPEWCENCLIKPLASPPRDWCYVDAEQYYPKER